MLQYCRSFHPFPFIVVCDRHWRQIGSILEGAEVSFEPVLANETSNHLPSVTLCGKIVYQLFVFHSDSPVNGQMARGVFRCVHTFFFDEWELGMWVREMKNGFSRRGNLCLTLYSINRWSQSRVEYFFHRPL